MTAPIQNSYFPLSADDHSFIHHVASYAVQRKFHPKPGRTHTYQEQKRNYLQREFISDLRHMLTAPHEVSAKKVGKVFFDLNNIDRLQLLRMRPQLIRNCHDLEFIMNEYIPIKDRVLFACTQIHLLYDVDLDRALDNINRVTQLIPWNQVEKFHMFAVKMMMRHRQKSPQNTIETEPSLPTHAYSFSAGFILAAANILGRLYGSGNLFNIATLLGSAGYFAHGCYDLYQQQPIHKAMASISDHLYTIWQQTQYRSSIDQNTPAPRL